jgi:hypothetical protein
MSVVERLGRLSEEVRMLSLRVNKHVRHDQKTHGRGRGGSRAGSSGKSSLETAGVKSSEVLGGGVSETQLVTLEDGTKAVFKPTSGEPKKILHDNITPGMAATREVAAGEVAKLGGVQDLVASSAKRSVDGKPGVIVEFQKGTVGAKARNFGKDNQDVQRAAVFDFVIGNQDRHAGNWLVNRGKLKLIDHDLAFPDKGKYRSNHPMSNTLIGNQAFMANLTGTGISSAAFKSVTRPYLKNREAILSGLRKQGLPESAVRGVGRRIAALKGKTSFTGMEE